jgi:hypothetical protein
MDLKELYLRQRVAAASAAAAISPQAKLSHRELAASYADRIENYDASGEERYSSTRSTQAGAKDDEAMSLIALLNSQLSSASR